MFTEEIRVSNYPESGMCIAARCATEEVTLARLHEDCGVGAFLVEVQQSCKRNQRSGEFEATTEQ